jgi:hypothetical protein
MSLRDELKYELEAAEVNYNSLRIDKDEDYKGRTSTRVHLIINGDHGPVFFDTTFADDLGLDSVAAARLVAKNALRAYNNHVKQIEKEAFSE